MARTEYGRHKKVVTGAQDGSKQVSKNEWNDDVDQKGIWGFDDVVKTLVTGAFVLSDTFQVIAAESGTADDLATITATDAQANDWVIIRADTGDTITVKSGTGNIELPAGKDIALVAAQLNYLILIFDGTNWRLPKVLGNSIIDENGNELIDLTKVASAVNHIEVKNATTGNPSKINAVGGDANIDLLFKGKGTGVPKVTSIKIVTIVDTNGNELLKFVTTGSAVNELQVTNSATGNPVTLETTGGDTDIDLIIQGKGIGIVRGVRESYGYALSDEDTVLATGVKITTAIVNYDFNIDSVIISLKVAGTGAALVTVDILRETVENSNVFETIFTTKPTIDAAEFTSKTAATAAVISTSLDNVLKGERIQLKIDTIDTDNVATGLKVIIAGHALAS